MTENDQVPPSDLSRLIMDHVPVLQKAFQKEKNRWFHLLPTGTLKVHKEDIYLNSCQYAYLRNCVYKSYKTHTESNETGQTYCKMGFWSPNRI